MNVINAKEALLTETHLCLVMEYAACGSLTGYVAEQWQHAQKSGLFLQEDEARYFFRVGTIYGLEHCLPGFADRSRCCWCCANLARVLPATRRVLD